VAVEDEIAAVLEAELLVAALADPGRCLIEQRAYLGHVVLPDTTDVHRRSMASPKE
jgi:hypothetical protein